MWGWWGGLRHTWATSIGAAGARSEAGWVKGQEEAEVVGLLEEKKKNTHTIYAWVRLRHCNTVLMLDIKYKWWGVITILMHVKHWGLKMSLFGVIYCRLEEHSDLPIVIGKNGVAPALRCSSAMMAASKDRHILWPWHNDKHKFTSLQLLWCLNNIFNRWCLLECKQ